MPAIAVTGMWAMSTARTILRPAEGNSRRRVATAAVLEFAVFMVLFVAYLRPFLLNPTDIRNDSSTYLAAGQRLNADRPLYALSPGDRPVATMPALPGVPLLSHPTVAVLWRVLALLPGDTSMWLWWALGLASVLATVWVLVRGGSVPALLTVVLLSFDIAWTALSGNVNAFLLPLMAACWWCYERGQATQVGLLAALATAAKLTPAILLWWLIATRQWRALLVASATLLVLLMITIAGAGVGSLFAWFNVARGAAGVAGFGGSIQNLLGALGLPGAVLAAVAPAAGVLCLVGVYVFRAAPRWAFALAAVGTALVVPVAHSGSLAVLLPATAPFARLPVNVEGGTAKADVVSEVPAAR